MMRALGFAEEGVTSGFSTWNPADKSAAMVLSSGNDLATKPSATSGGSWCSVRGTTGHAAGRLYFEAFIMTATFTNNLLLGIAPNSTPVSDWVGQDVSTYGFYAANGNFYSAAAAILSPGQTWAQGDTIRCALDLTHLSLWLSKIGSSWNGSGPADPATNVGGISISAGTYFPTFSSEGTATREYAALLNTGGSAFSGTVPAGFSAWG